MKKNNFISVMVALITLAIVRILINRVGYENIPEGIIIVAAIACCIIFCVKTKTGYDSKNKYNILVMTTFSILCALLIILVILGESFVNHSIIILIGILMGITTVLMIISMICAIIHRNKILKK
ncbi:hypothetical protein KQI30_07550 [Clostridium bornimense]|uniref:hypothetical protein n=1 Tax=Clostridium bornimense TaxID=1216932 RepID=UPI001C0FE60C|nr:hypothetical protein [Clostridium bornimense]MBU5316124.1 hypothetical protein [Clostridium bornimense]